MTASEVKDLMPVFDKALIERTIGAGMNMHHGYQPHQLKSQSREAQFTVPVLIAAQPQIAG